MNKAVFRNRERTVKAKLIHVKSNQSFITPFQVVDEPEERKKGGDSNADPDV